MRTHINPNIGPMRLTQLRRRHIRHLLNDELAIVGPRMRKHVYRVVHYALNQAVEDDIIAANPCFKSDRPKYEPGEHRALSIDGAKRLLDKARDGDYYLLFYLALATAMREGKILGLRWSTIDLDGGSLFVNATLTRNRDRTPVLRPPKANRKRRIDLGPKLSAMLNEHKRQQYPLSPWVFTDKNGEPLAKDRFDRKVFHPLLKEAGIERIRFYDLRHTSATLGLANGENVKALAERLGHSSAKLTLDVYTKSIPTLQREAAIRMDALLAGHGDTKGDTRPAQEPSGRVKAL